MHRLVEAVLHPRMRRWRYIAVGGWNTLFGLMTFIAVNALIGESVGYALVLTIATIISVSQAYVTQRTLVWRSTQDVPAEFSRFVTTYVLGYLVNLALLWLLRGRLHMPLVQAQLAVTVIIVGITYLVHRTWTFRQSRHLSAAPTA